MLLYRFLSLLQAYRDKESDFATKQSEYAAVTAERDEVGWGAADRFSMLGSALMVWTALSLTSHPALRSWCSGNVQLAIQLQSACLAPPAWPGRSARSLASQPALATASHQGEQLQGLIQALAQCSR